MSVSAQSPDGRPAIYLAPAATPPLTGFRDKVKDYLALELPGVRVLPEESESRGGVEAFTSAARAEIGRSAIFVQVLDINPGTFVFDDAIDVGLVALLHDCAKAEREAKEILQWRDPDVTLPHNLPHRKLMKAPPSVPSTGKPSSG